MYRILLLLGVCVAKILAETKPITVLPKLPECKLTVLGKDYAGKVSVTKTGRTCQRWDRQYPQEHTRNNIDDFPDHWLSQTSNYCRNPDGEPEGPWCYTMDVDKRWEYCDIPLCTTHKNEYEHDEYEFFDDRDCQGHDLLPVVSDAFTLDLCKMWCSQKSECLSFQFNKFNQCYLKNRRCSEEQMTHASMGRMYNKKARDEHDEYEFFDDRDCQGHDLLPVVSDAFTLDLCKMWCSQKSECLSFQFNKFNQCYLKNRRCSEEQMTHASMGRMYNKKARDEREYEFFDDKDCHGHDIINSMMGDKSTLEECKDRCSQNDECLSFQFNTMNECYLKNRRCAEEQMTYASMGRMYNKEPAEEEVVASGYAHLAGKDCHGRDIEGFSDITLQSCKRKCDIDPSCVSFQYNQNRDCWIKNHICTDAELTDIPWGNMYVKNKAPEPEVPMSENLAVNRPAYQSSISWSGAPGRAVDGNDDMAYFHDSCSHTTKQTKPWWTVDLGESTLVSGVAITNRADCCSDRLNNYYIIVMNERPTEQYRLPEYGDENVCAYRSDTHLGTLNLRCREPVRGRYLVIRINHRAVLTLCEVKVYSGTLPTTWIHGDENPMPKPVPTAEFVHLSGVDCNGRDIGGIEDKTLDECKQECSQRKNCLSIQYNSNKKQCWLKWHRCTRAEMVTLPNGNMYQRITDDWKPEPETTSETPTTAAPGPLAEFEHLPNKDCSGRDIRGVFETTLENCKLLCSEDAKCLSFQFNINKDCWLKWHRCSESELDTTFAGNIYQKIITEERCEAEDRGHRGEDLMDGYIASADTCRTDCINNDQCRGSTHDDRDHCWLHSNIKQAAVYYASGFTLFIKDCAEPTPVPPLPETGEHCQVEGRGHEGLNLDEQGRTTTAAQCRIICIQDEECMGSTHDIRNHCWLHSQIRRERLYEKEGFTLFIKNCEDDDEETGNEVTDVSKILLAPKRMRANVAQHPVELSWEPLPESALPDGKEYMYEVEYWQEEKTSAPKHKEEVSAPPLQRWLLIPGRSYQFRVRAAYKGEDQSYGPWSKTYDFQVSKFIENITLAPKRLRANVAEYPVELSWEPLPESALSEGEEYIYLVEYWQEDKTSAPKHKEEVSAPLLERWLLIPGRSYQFRVRAAIKGHEEASAGPWSDTYDFKVSKHTVTTTAAPDYTILAPEDLKVNGDTYPVTVSWTPLPDSSLPEGQEYTYQVEYWQKEKTEAPKHVEVVESPPLERWLLTPGRSYVFRVRAGYKDGSEYGPWSAEVETIIKKEDEEEVPDTIGKITEKPDNLRTDASVYPVVLSWDPVPMKGGKAYMYQVEYGPIGGAQERYQEEVLSPPLTRYLLEEGVTYAFEVRAFDADTKVYGPWSFSHMFTVPRKGETDDKDNDKDDKISGSGSGAGRDEDDEASPSPDDEDNSTDEGNSGEAVEGPVIEHEYTHFDSRDCNGRDIKGIKRTTLAKCKAACNQLEECKSFQFNVNNDCWLKRYRCNRYEMAYTSDGNMYQKEGTKGEGAAPTEPTDIEIAPELPEPTEPIATTESPKVDRKDGKMIQCKVQNKDCTSAGFPVKMQVTEKMCSMYCEGLKDCQAAAYRPDSSVKPDRCILYSLCDVKKDSVGTMLYFKMPEADGCPT